jgi:MFS family permease
MEMPIRKDMPMWWVTMPETRILMDSIVNLKPVFMETLTVSTAAPREAEMSIQWKQLWSLAALYGSIVIGWIAYENYQPRLLLQFNFTDFAFLLLAAQGVILVVTPMIAGRLGDKYRFEKGHRLPIISSGISFAAMVFMAVAFTLLGNPGEVFRWILPVLIVCWLIAMSIFTSPALSTVELFTPIDKLPHAMAILTITGNLIYALEPVIVDLIDYLGAPITFMLGGVVTFASGYALKKNSLGLFRQSGNAEAGSVGTKGRRSPYELIFFMGLSLGIATAILFDIFPPVLQHKLGALLSLDGKFILVSILVLSAVMSWPMSHLADRYGIGRLFWISILGLALTATGILYLNFAPFLLSLVVLYTMTFTSLSVVSLPLAISRASAREKVFCVGIFFSGAAVPDAVLQLMQ